MNHDIVVIVPYRNCEAFIEECLQSINSQKYKNFSVIVIDDNSDDNSSIESSKISFKNSLHSTMPERKYSLHNTVYALKKIEWFNPETIVMIVDGDDRLEHDYVFDIVNDHYNDHKCLLTYGNFTVTSPSQANNLCCSYTEDDFKNLRLHSFRCSHLRTFKYKLWEELRGQDPEFLFAREEDGSWLKSAGDVALQHALMEIAGYDNVNFIDSMLYRYRIHENNDAVLNRDDQIRCMQIANKLKPFKQVF